MVTRYKQLIDQIYLSEINQVDSVVSRLLLMQFGKAYQHHIERLTSLMERGRFILKEGFFFKIMGANYQAKQYQSYLDEIKAGMADFKLFKFQTNDRISEISELLIALKDANTKLDRKISIEDDVRREIVGQFQGDEKKEAGEYLDRTLMNARKLYLLQQQTIVSTGLSLESYNMILDSIDNFSFILIPSLELRIGLKKQQAIIISQRERDIDNSELKGNTSLSTNESDIENALNSMQYTFNLLNDNIQKIQNMINVK